MGIDRLFVDEAHSFKNLFLYTKMRNVGGIAQTEAQKSSDLYMKCRYLDEVTGNKGVVFATGTPVSNSMVELYTMQRYLQYDALSDKRLQHFDSWASTFGETVTAIELAPEGTGYRAKTRFAKFYNLPELMMMFKQVADIQTADMLNLPVPKANYHNIAVKPTDIQKEIVASLGERAEKVRNKMVDSSQDNMLLITNDGRKLALDQRLTNEMLPDEPDSKVSVCADNVFKIWEKTAEQKSTQLIFCDLSTPHNDGKFNVYDDIKKKLIAKGVTDTDKFKSYLDVQSRFDRYSVSNAILVTHQMPEATKLGDSKYWQEQGVYINKGEKAITILEPGKEFTREDGTTGVSYNAKKVFDITQTNAEDTRRNRKLPNENILIKILVKTSPVPVEIRSDLPEGIPAIYDSEKNEIRIMQGMTAEEIFRALSKEIAHASMDKGEYNREANEFTARAVSYITCRRMGFEPEGFERNEKLFEDRSAKEIRKELSKIRSEANSIITSMEKTIEARAKNRDAR